VPTHPGQGKLDIAIVIVSFNSEKFLADNLCSLAQQSLPFKEIIVVDNLSADRSREIISAHPGVIPMFLDYNSGYARAANLGINRSTAPLILVANSDIILEAGFNRLVAGKFAQDPDLDILSPLILRFDRQTVDSAGQTPSASLFPKEIGFNRPIRQIELKEQPIFSVCGAATVFRRSALEKLKIDGEYYDEDFFIFWEDFDIGWRAHRLKLKTLFYPEAVVFHYRSGTLKKNFLSRFSLSLSRPAAIKYHLVKNRYLTLIKNFELRRNWRALPFIILKDFIWVPLLTIGSPKIIIRLMKTGKLLKRALLKRGLIKKRIRKHE
jgi:GT2 family glycosyltransferase